MGKSGKKVKSDKINALRKQYDAFLEEDKKRKDRNEFILGRLEHMRFSNIIPVPIHHQKIQLMRDYYTFPQRPYISKPEFCAEHCKGEQSNLLSAYNRNLEEKSILTEISKKYILIPKIQSTFESDTGFTNSPMKNITDINWKNKYNILDELKRNEKETTHDNDNKKQDLHENNKDMAHTGVPLNVLHNENPLLDSNWKKEHEQYQSLLCNEKMDQSEKNNNLSISAKERGIIQNSPENIKDSELNSPSDKKETKLNKVMCDSKENKNDQDLIDNTNIKITTDEQEKITETKENKDYLQEKVYHNNLENESKEEIREAPVSSARGDENINTYIHTNSNENFEEEVMRERTECGIINQQLDSASKNELAQGQEEKLESEDIHLNNTEEYKAEEDNFDNRELTNFEVGKLVDSREQQLYTNSNENNDENQVNDVPVDYVTENENYMNVDNQVNNEPEDNLNENYTNEEYTYYDESHQEPYTNQINEHEESSGRYDQNYEQQYANNYDDPNMAQYQNQQYEVENTYDQQDTSNIVYDSQNAGDVNYEYANPENITTTDHPEHDNIYNYENEVSDNQQYDSNMQQEYSAIQNDQYGHQQEYNETETIESVEKQLDPDSGLTENMSESVNTVGSTKNTSENIQSDVTLP